MPRLKQEQIRFHQGTLTYTRHAQFIEIDLILVDRGFRRFGVGTMLVDELRRLSGGYPIYGTVKMVDNVSEIDLRQFWLKQGAVFIKPRNRFRLGEKP